MSDIRPSADEWMSLAEFGAIVGKKISTLYNERSRGLDFPVSYVFSKKTVRLRRSDVDTWLEKRRRITSREQLKAAE